MFSTLQGARRVFGDAQPTKGCVDARPLGKGAPSGEEDEGAANPKKRTHTGALWACILVGFFGMMRKDNLIKGKWEPFKKASKACAVSYVKGDDVDFA